MPTPVVDRSPTASDSEEYEYEEVEVEEEIEVEEEVEEEEEEEEEQKEDRDDVNIPPAAAPVEDRSPTASDSEEYEYEETEVEEEMEVEEEVTDDEEEECEEVEEDLKEEVEEEEEEAVVKEQKQEQEEKGSREDEPLSIEDQDDVKNEQKEEQQEEKGNGEDVSLSIEDQVDVKRKEKIISDDEKASQCDGGIMTAVATNPMNESSKPVTVRNSVDESDKVPRSEEQTTQMYRKDATDAHLKEPRLDVDVTLIRPQSSSPAVEINEGNKRPALVCDFFAKGWCIKGTSCRFRHIKDPPINVVDQQNEPQKNQPQDEGVKESTGRSDDPATSATASTVIASSSEYKPGSQKDNPITATNSPVNKSLDNPFMGPNTHRSSWASFAPKVQEFSSKGYHFGLHNHSYNSNYHGTVWPRTSTFLSSSSRKSDSKVSSNDWELSKPFRSTFLISQGISTPDIQYDPIRDSIEQPAKNADKLSKVSSSSRVPSISGTHSPLQEKLKTDFVSDRISIGSHVNGNDDDTDMDVDSNEIADTKQETTKSEGKGKRHIGDIEGKGKRHIGDIIQASEVHASGHSSLRQNDDGPTKEVNNYKLDFDAEGDMLRESRSLRHFRASLIEFVKELVRPSWRDGKLSKDAHKLIVKKAVDKVLNSLPPEHVPDVRESIDAYLTSSQPKLMKLVEGYIEKYGKL